MSDANIIVEYVCECGNTSPAAGGGNSPGSHNYVVGKALTVYAHCRVICLNCGKDMKLNVSKEEYKREVTVISEA